MSSEDARPKIPSILQSLSTDEYDAPQLNATQRSAVGQVISEGETDAHRVRRSLGDYWSSRLGTAAGLRALNDAFGVQCYDVPEAATLDQEAADAAFSVAPFVIDVQTHMMADRDNLVEERFRPMAGFYQMVGPDWYPGVRSLASYNFEEWLRSVFLESDTAVAILSAPPADENGIHYLTNDEMAVTRELIDRLTGTGRLFNHTVVHPTEPGALESMEMWRDTLNPIAWKVYTMGHLLGADKMGVDEASGFMLDDERWGLPFLEHVRKLGGQHVCAHKGLSMMVDNGSPHDLGPCARMFPDLKFIAYHSGFEDASMEGPYTEETKDLGSNRLITTARDNGIGLGGNIYAELGTTWYCLIKNPVEAAHLLGKFLLTFGEDNILWGTDSCWYGPTQTIVDAFRAFQIPEDLSAQYGYPQLTPAIKEKILGLNASRLYDIDVDAARSRFLNDDLSWAKAAVAAYRANGNSLS